MLGFGGGEIAAFEYRLALALGATVGVVSGTGRAVDELLKDSLWSAVPGLRLFPLPPDAKTLRAFVVPDGFKFDPAVLDVMAREFHARYMAANVKKIKPEMLKPWEYLPDDLLKRQPRASRLRYPHPGNCRLRGAPGQRRTGPVCGLQAGGDRTHGPTGAWPLEHRATA